MIAPANFGLPDGVEGEGLVDEEGWLLLDDPVRFLPFVDRLVRFRLWQAEFDDWREWRGRLRASEGPPLRFDLGGPQMPRPSARVALALLDRAEGSIVTFHGLAHVFAGQVHMDGVNRDLHTTAHSELVCGGSEGFYTVTTADGLRSKRRLTGVNDIGEMARALGVGKDAPSTFAFWRERHKRRAP